MHNIKNNDDVKHQIMLVTVCHKIAYKEPLHKHPLTYDIILKVLFNFNFIVI